MQVQLRRNKPYDTQLRWQSIKVLHGEFHLFYYCPACQKDVTFIPSFIVIVIRFTFQVIFFLFFFRVFFWGGGNVMFLNHSVSLDMDGQMAILKDTAWIIISQSRAGGGEDVLMALVLK